MENPTNPIQLRIQTLLESLNHGLYEREEAMALALLSALAEESIFLLGPPGVAKSMIARRLRFAFEGGRSFEYLMNRFSTPDEVFGPVSISRLRLEDKYERQTERYLPGARIVFLDEIWKAGPAIQNALLTVINEKVYRNGEQEVPVELRGLIAASNELPEKGQGLEALWDRFLLRLQIYNIGEELNFFRMITASGQNGEDPVPEDLKITQEELLEWSAKIDQVEVPDKVLTIISRIRKRLPSLALHEKPGLAISDRRWKKIVRLLRTAAFTLGRKAVDPIDCYMIANCMWEKPSQHQPITDLVDTVIGEVAIDVNERAMNQEKNELDRKISEHMLRKVEVVEPRPQMHDLPDSARNYLVHLPDGTSYYIPESAFHRLEYDRSTPLDLTYRDKEEFRVFPQAMVRRSRSPFGVVVGELEGQLDTFDTIAEAEEYVRPDEPVLAMLEEEAGILMKKVVAAINHVREVEDNLSKAMHVYPYLKVRLSMWEPFRLESIALNDLKLRIHMAIDLLNPQESNPQTTETA